MHLTMRMGKVTQTAGLWWRRGAVGSVLVGAGVATGQVRGLLAEWRTRHIGSASPCGGPTDGLENRHGSAFTRSCSRAAASAHVGRGDAGTAGKATEVGVKRPRTLVLFLGDSLVSGVGGQADHVPLPAALPRAVAARLSEKASGGTVQWASVGIIGAGVDKLAEEGLPRLRAKIKACREDTANVVVVLVVGVNDLKQMNLFGYRMGIRRLVTELRSLVSELRHAARSGQVVDVFLPELSIADAPLLQRFPLCLFARPVCALWEREKRQAVNEVANTEVLSFPKMPEGEDVGPFFSPDAMHPSLRGYEWWAEGLAQQIHSRLAARAEAAAAVLSRVVE